MTLLQYKLEVVKNTRNTLNITLTNASKYPVRFLRWNTPFDSLEANIFDVKMFDGEIVDYIGKRAKRQILYQESTLYIDSKSSLSINVNIGRFYNFKAIAVHIVRISSLRLHFTEVTNRNEKVTEDTLKIAETSCNTVEIEIYPEDNLYDEHPLSSEIPSIPIEGKPIAFEYDETHTPTPICPPIFLCMRPAYHIGGECYNRRYISYPEVIGTNEETKNSLKRLYLKLIKTYIMHRGEWIPDRWDFHTCPIYKKWFGSYNKYLALHVAKTLSAITSYRGCMPYSIIVDNFCTKNKDTVAYFRKSNDPTRVDVLGICSLFFRLNETGLNSKPGTIGHELSHGYGNTEDHGYGINECIILAKNEPEKAIENADSYQYYLEEKKPF